jgi:formate-dependent nitrite reductase cytochrome c552 subunit
MMRKWIRWALATVGVLVTAMFLATGASAEKGTASQAAGAKPSADDESDATDILGANAACYVCHMTFVKEELATVHLKEKIGCIQCHGPSDKHANDEHIGATKPDIVFKRDQIDKSCMKCHEGHDVPAKAVVARFVERKLPVQASPVCTECHGMHKIAKADKAAQ